MNIIESLITSDFYLSPLVFAVYCLSVSCKLRSSNSWSRQETHANVIGSLISIITVNLGGRFLISLVKGEGLAQVLKNDDKVAIVLLCWALVYFSPRDIVYRLAQRLKIPIHLLNAWKRSRDINAGLIDGIKYAPGSIVVPILICILSGWGGSLLFPFEAKSRGKQVHNDLQTPSIPFLTVCFVSVLSVLSVHFSQLSIQQSAYGSMVITLIESVAFEMGVWAKAQRFFRGTTGTKLKTDDIVKDTNASVKETPAGVRKRTPRVAKKLN